MAKISWSKALADYLKDETQSYASIAREYGVSLQAAFRLLYYSLSHTIIFRDGF